MDFVGTQHSPSPLPIGWITCTRGWKPWGIKKVVKKRPRESKRKAKSKGGRIRSYVSGETRNPYFLPPLFLLLRIIRLLILYSALFFIYLSFVLSWSLRGHWSSPYDPEIPSRSVSQVSTRINFRKRKSVLEDYGHASQENLNIHAKVQIRCMFLFLPKIKYIEI